jgi:formylglycine-generating enzyme required for sulfatase activity
MVRVLSPGGLAYCIDTTEVTWGQYAAFLKAKGGDTSGQPAECAWNDRYEPRTGDPKEVGGCAPLDYTHPTGYAEKPVECVDWCDALGYCTWAGKRLCGKVGGGTAPQNASTDPNVSEWYNACSQGGTTVYPYGNQISPDACNTDAATDAGCALDSSASCRKTTPVGSLTSCRGTKPPYDQIFDMVGNVMEWEDACQSSKCLIRGEAYQSPDARCASPGQTWMQSAAPGGGFRCCADPK